MIGRRNSQKRTDVDQSAAGVDSKRQKNDSEDVQDSASYPSRRCVSAIQNGMGKRIALFNCLLQWLCGIKLRMFDLGSRGRGFDSD